jgi:GAF domain-containing protein
VIEQQTLHVWEWLAAYSGTRDAPLTLSTICEACAWRTGMTGAWITYGDPFTEAPVATDPVAGRLADQAALLGEGPDTDAADTGRPVAVTDLSAPPHRRAWPVYSAAALAAGARSVLAVPLRTGTTKIGLLGLYSRRPRVLVAPERVDVDAIADVVIGLLLADICAPARASQCPEIHQATGIVAAQLGVGVGEALARLRAHAYANATPLSEIAHRVVSRRLRIPPNTWEDGIGGS